MILHKGFGSTAQQQQAAALGGVGTNTATILGIKVVGGKLMQGGTRIGAVVEKVKKGSVADTVGKLLPGEKLTEAEYYVGTVLGTARGHIAKVLENFYHLILTFHMFI